MNIIRHIRLDGSEVRYNADAIVGLGEGESGYSAIRFADGTSLQVFMDLDSLDFIMDVAAQTFAVRKGQAFLFDEATIIGNKETELAPVPQNLQISITPDRQQLKVWVNATTELQTDTFIRVLYGSENDDLTNKNNLTPICTLPPLLGQRQDIIYGLSGIPVSGIPTLNEPLRLFCGFVTPYANSALVSGTTNYVAMDNSELIVNV